MIYTATIKRRHVLFSITGFSIMGAVANNVTQVLIAYLFCIRHSGILFMLPWLALAALPTGFLTGMISRKILLSLDMHNIKSAANHDIFEIPEKKNTDFIHAGIKKRFFLILIPILAVIILKNVILNVSMILLMLFILYISRISLKSSIGRMKHALLIICLSVLIPVFFNDSGQILLKIGPVAVTSDAISQSAIYLTRIITFMLGAHFLVQTSSKQELAGMIVRLLSPFKFFGIPFEKYSNIIIMSWISIPEFLNRINNSLSLSSKEKHKFREKINIFTDLIASFFVEQNENAPENSV
jgi:energy-coupling factor transporter transmembrane protein EcfT